MDLKNLMLLAVQSSLRAGDVVLGLHGQIEFVLKDDSSPLTEADLQSHRILCEELTGILRVPVVSEEAELEYKVRKDLEYYWLIDPLDGSKDFLAQNGQWCINIALMEQRHHITQPILGVIYAPMLEKLYCAAKGCGVYTLCDFQNKTLQSLKTSQIPSYIALTSNFHNTQESRDFIQRYYLDSKPLGASLKFCMLASGHAYIYPRFTGSKEWDSAAGDIILFESGGVVLDYVSKCRLAYNKESLKNNYFVAFSKAAVNGMIYKEFLVNG
ncbi:MAG: 3'(2'),5'-bisphosphate nucleotidase CysQ [Helicobacter sp.]|uniref:3'(2'),5'-bisphosphate nucleotidase CysQ family protein n=1 Tax=Helicobacter sp. 10-6591 TaxID=2004998 RepID=UPI00215C2A71|nr:3'(2'),5'-bisphosphate nucleotidase CysQ [Helicobacter sp. 10-6591]MCI6217223.1 3'(2'),5'-bisphosphate nucleotidase CysQ [Helicobacter sp.]MCI7484641.1 3'(2'),5'-bisphosphate nucleotidase CysQ [Helicobacter sp.]